MNLRVFLIGVSILLCSCTASSNGAEGVPPRTGAAVTPLSSVARESPHCGSVSGTSARYGSHLGASTGRPGDPVAVYGPTLRGEDGRFARSKRLEVWWNAKNPGVRGVEPDRANPDSPVVLLATVRDMDACRFRTTFEVPDGAPGRYPIRTVVYWKGGYGWFGHHPFTIKASDES